jgi:hypothetical protein
MEKEIFLNVMTVLLWLIAIVFAVFIAFKMLEEFKRWNKKRLKIKASNERYEALRRSKYKKE